MAFYAEEEEVWKCSLHPSKRRRTGVCPSCLKERLSALCPDSRYSTVDEKPPPEKLAGKSSSFWSVIWWQKKPRREKVEAEMRRSKSVAVAGNNDVVGVSKGKGWYFPSPMKVFRQSYSKTPKVVHERSPLHRG
uniref:Uncharacterized protein n=1 Tax=Chenopodium quinoa TaxID=63459 RepID=A0A803LU12_CHEQI